MDNYNNGYNQRPTQSSYTYEQKEVKAKKTKKEKKKDKKRRKRAIIITIIIVLAILLALLFSKFGFGGGNGFGLGKGNKDGDSDGNGQQTTTVQQGEYQTKADEGHVIKVSADKVIFNGVEYTDATINNLKTEFSKVYKSGDKVTLETTSTALDSLITTVKGMLTSLGATPTEKDV